MYIFWGSKSLPADERPPIPYVPELDDPTWRPVYGQLLCLPTCCVCQCLLVPLSDNLPNSWKAVANNHLVAEHPRWCCALELAACPAGAVKWFAHDYFGMFGDAIETAGICMLLRSALL